MNLRQTTDCQNTRVQHVLKDIAHTDTFQLAVIAQHNELRAGRNSTQKCQKNLRAHHGNLIQNDDLLHERTACIMQKVPILIAQQPVNSHTLPPRYLSKTSSGTTGKSTLGKGSIGHQP